MLGTTTIGRTDLAHGSACPRWALLAVAGAVLGACSGGRGGGGDDEPDAGSVPADYGRSCAGDEECAAPAHCTPGAYASWVDGTRSRCLQTCSVDADCHGLGVTAYCLVCAGVESSCILPEVNERWTCEGGISCVRNSDCNTGCCSPIDGYLQCSPGMFCGPSTGPGSGCGCQQRFDLCETDSDCVAGDRCFHETGLDSPLRCYGTFSGGDTCSDCLDACRGLPSCCTGEGCMCDTEC